MPTGIGTATLLGLAASAGTGVAGALANMSAQDRANLLQDKSVQEWMKLNIPDPKEQELALQQFVQVGKLTPQLEQGVKAVEPEIMKFASDPRLKEARLRSLGALEQQGYGGEQVQDTAARDQALIESGATNRGQQEAITSSLARRGQLGSGLELQARLAASQGNQDQTAKNALDIEAQRRNRALQSITGAGDLAGDISNQEFGQASAKSAAKSAIDQFNAQNLQNVANRNVSRINDTNAANLGQAQKTADLNATTANYQQEHNKNLIQQQFENNAKKTAGVTGQYGQQAGQAIQNGQSAGNMWAGIGAGLTSAAAGQAALDAKKKKQLEGGLIMSDNDQDAFNKVYG